MYIYINILYIILYKYVTNIYFLIYIHIIYWRYSVCANNRSTERHSTHLWEADFNKNWRKSLPSPLCVWNLVNVWNLCQQLYESVLSSVLLPWPMDQGVLLAVPIPFWSSSCPAISPNPGCPLCPIIQRPKGLSSCGCISKMGSIVTLGA